MVYSMIESEYTANVHKRLPAYMRAWKVNDNYAGGVPDAFYRNKGPDAACTLWIEYKFLKALPKRDTTMIVPDLSSLQMQWLVEAHVSMIPENAIVIVGVENVEGIRGAAGFVMTAAEWETGIPTREARLRCLNYQGICDLIVNNTIIYQ